MSIEKEAEAFVSEKADKGNFDVEKFGKAYFSESSMKQALVKFAEPREKRIEELEQQIEKMKRHCNCKHRDSEGYCEVRKTYLIDLSYDGCDKWELED